MSLLAYQKNKPSAAFQSLLLFKLQLSKSVDAFMSAGDVVHTHVYISLFLFISYAGI